MIKKLINNLIYKKEVLDEIEKTKILGGVFYIKTHKQTLEKRIRIFGFLIYQKKLRDSLQYQALSKYLKTKNITKKFVYNFAGSPSGELYILLNLFAEISNNKKNEDIIFLVDKEFKKNLCMLYKPEIECIIVNSTLLGFYSESSYKDENYEICSLFTTKHYLEQDILINKNNEHYYEYILKDLKLKGLSEFKLPNISEEVKKKIKKYINTNKLRKFIIISPEANTCSKYSEAFWKNLCERLKEESYEIFLNIMQMQNYIEGCHINYFNYEELIELAKYSKGIIGLRSGLMEILSTLNIPIACIYTSFPQRGTLKAMDSNKGLTGFTLKKLPGTIIDNISEFDVNNYSKEELINLIIDSLNRKKLCNKNA